MEASETVWYCLLLALVFALGTAVASFLNVVIYRLPLGKDFVKGRSQCPQCGHSLKALDLVPVLSYLVLGRRCRYCKEPISPRYLLVELLGGAMALACFLAYLPPGGFALAAGSAQELARQTASQAGLVATWLPLELPAFTGAISAAALSFFVGCLLVCVTFIDADTMEIPNGLSLWLAALALVGMVLGPTAALPWQSHLIGAVCVSVPMLALALLIPGAFGLGDVKLMAAAGLLLGWQLTLAAAFMGILLGGLYGCYVLVTRKKGRKEHFAFGPALSAGIFASLLMGEYLITWYAGFF